MTITDLAILVCGSPLIFFVFVIVCDRNSIGFWHRHSGIGIVYVPNLYLVLPTSTSVWANFFNVFISVTSLYHNSQFAEFKLITLVAI